MKKFIILLPLCCLVFGVFCQTTGSQFNLPQVIQNAPEAAAMGRYGEIPVAINTGVPNINIPLFTVQSGNLSLPLSISYHASGIKVMDQPTTMGLGWVLNAGGCISRVVQGIEDENAYGYGFYNIIFPDPADPSLAAREKCLAANITNTFTGQQPWDGQPDLFYYNFATRSGKFILKNRKAAGLFQGYMTIPYDPIKISNPGGGFTDFQLTDVDGTIYYFGGTPDNSQTTTNSVYKSPVPTTWHLTKIISADRADSIVFVYGQQTTNTATVNPRSLVRAFQAATSNTQSYYSYSGYSISTTTTTQQQLTEIDFANGKVTFDYGVNEDASNTTRMDAMHVYNNQSGTYIEIKKINFSHSAFTSTDNGNTYYSLRLDGLQESGLIGGSTIQNPPYSFTYYSTGNFQAPPFMSKGQDFWGYFNGKTSNPDLIAVAAPMQILTSQDVSSAAYKRTPDSAYMLTGTLQTIQYPTGGVDIFEFEPNQIPHTRTIIDTTIGYLSGAYVTTFDMTAGNTNGTSVQFTVNNALQILTQPNGQGYNAKLDFTGSIVCTSGCLRDDPVVKLDDLTTGTTVSNPNLSVLNSSNPPSSAEQIVYLSLVQGHTYHLYLTNPGSLTGSQTWRNLQFRLDATISAQYVASTTSTTVTSNVYSGGLRISKITSDPKVGNRLIKQYNYTQAYFNSNLFDGSYDDLALNNYQFDGWNIVNGNSGQCSIWGISTRTYSENACLPLGSVSNNSVSYSQVEEYQSDGNGNYNGKTVYRYNPVQDIITMGEPFYKIDEEDQRGLLLEKEVYKSQNGSFQLIQDINNTYEDLDVHLSMPPDTVVFYTAHALVDNSVSKNGNPGSPPTGGAAFGCFWCNSFDAQTLFQTNKWYYTSPRMVLQSSVITTYDDNGHGLPITQSYDYQSPLHIFPTHISSVNSKGKTLDTYSQYVLDYPNSSCTNSASSSFQQSLNALKATYFPQFGTYYNQFLTNDVQQGYPNCSPLNQQAVLDADNGYSTALTNYNNAVASLVSTYNSNIASYNSCVASYYASAGSDQQAIMDLQSMNNISPVLQTTKYTNGILMSTTQNFYKTFLPHVTLPSRVIFGTLSNPLENRLQYLSYDSHSKLKAVEKTGGVPVSYLWDYNNQYAVAEIKNADPSSVAYTSFEADGAGNWQYTPMTGTTISGITGDKSYNLSTGGISKTNLITGNSYVVSYWSQSGPYSITGGTFTTTQGKTIGGWTYFEHRVKASGTSINISGSGWIDELRLYPETAQMTTYAFTPLIGMSSQCDVNNRITYYKYDALGRLQVVQDQDGNVIKTIDYHYKGQ